MLDESDTDDDALRLDVVDTDPEAEGEAPIEEETPAELDGEAPTDSVG